MKEKTLCAEWIQHRKLYRLFEAIRPEETIAYEEDIETARKLAIENGYNDIVTE